ncbi:retrovirus-related Pol polyprotein [Elysia marginata]|uniref:Retrovirus-related Pol polyprotein n=1 Tax=Elysia marginata TaxID=1093978 RepID=A0AAV4J200_9GAST|nr:retrovirus-related Pol polyprotein [Elysia marginata]
MLSLLSENRPCLLFRELFLRQLSEHVRTPLAISDTPDHRRLAQEADKLFLAAKQPTSLLNTPVNAAQCSEVEQHIDAACWYHRKCSVTRRRNVYHPVSTKRNRETPGRANSSIRRFLVDTGAQVSVAPATWFERRSGQPGSPLHAANGTSIPTYGSRNVPLCFNHRTYQAHLIIAVVKRPLLEKEHLQDIRTVCGRLRDFGLVIRLEKCLFGQKYSTFWAIKSPTLAPYHYPQRSRQSRFPQAYNGQRTPGIPRDDQFLSSLHPQGRCSPSSSSRSTEQIPTPTTSEMDNRNGSSFHSQQSSPLSCYYAQSSCPRCTYLLIRQLVQSWSNM